MATDPGRTAAAVTSGLGGAVRPIPRNAAIPEGVLGNRAGGLQEHFLVGVRAPAARQDDWVGVSAAVFVFPVQEKIIETSGLETRRPLRPRRPAGRDG